MAGKMEHDKHTAMFHMNRYLLAAIILTVASTVYWTAYSINAYNTFQWPYDLGDFVNGMYYDIHYPVVTHGLQLLIFDLHIEYDQLLFVLPLYYLYQSPLTLLFVQDFLLSVTGLIIFFVAREILKSDRIGLLLCFAYLINPGMQSMILYGYHGELWFLPSSALAIYFYLKANKTGFILSMLLLLGAIEVAPLIGISIGVGLAIYELMGYSKKDSEARRRLAYYAIAISVAMLLVFNLIYLSLTGSYANSYSSLPPVLREQAFPLVPLFGGAKLANGNVGLSDLINVTASPHAPIRLAMPFLGFSLAGFLVPLPFLVFSMPWLYAAFFAGGLFAGSWMGYVLGGGIIASILGFKYLMERPDNKGPSHRGRTIDRVCYLTLLLSIALWLVALGANYVISYDLTTTGPNNVVGYTTQFSVAKLADMLVLQSPSGVLNASSQLNSVIAELPQNASVFTQTIIKMHIANRQYLDVISEPPVTSVKFYDMYDRPLYFVPEYALLDSNPNITFGGGYGGYADLQNEYNATLGYMNASGNDYAVYAQNGSAVLYKCISGCG